MDREIIIASHQLSLSELEKHGNHGYGNNHYRTRDTWETRSREITITELDIHGEPRIRKSSLQNQRCMGNQGYRNNHYRTRYAWGTRDREMTITELEIHGNQG